MALPRAISHLQALPAEAAAVGVAGGYCPVFVSSAGSLAWKMAGQP